MVNMEFNRILPNARFNSRDTGRHSGKAELSVKQLPISKLPSDRNELIINAVPPDFIYARESRKNIFEGLIAAAASHEKNKFAP